MATGKNKAVPPVFIRWLGGKRWLAPRLVSVIDSFGLKKYYEPFLGGGSIFFYLNTRNAILSDVNSELINAYIEVQKNHSLVERKIKSFPIDLKFYNGTRRDLLLGTSIERAAKFLYLNRVCFSGIYRVNKKGEFNVPFGDRDTSFLSSGVLSAASSQLSGVKLLQCDFEKTLKMARVGDLVYCDPPYTALHNGEQFLRYNETLFSWSDQMRLADSARIAAQAGARVIVSNSACPSLMKIFFGASRILIHRQSRLSVKIPGRGYTSEALYILPKISRKKRLEIMRMLNLVD